MNLLRYSKLDLPVYPEDEVAWTSDDIREAARSEMNSFVRRTCLRYEGPERGLNFVLALGDSVLSTICKTTQVDVVGCRWGLALMSEATRSRLCVNDPLKTYDSSFTSYLPNSNATHIPKGYGLVASVDNIKGAQPLGYAQYERTFGYRSPSSIGIEVDGYQFFNDDLRHTSQFVLDSAKVALGASGIVIVDTEPRLHVVSNQVYRRRP
jgi:hypothetical protein